MRRVNEHTKMKPVNLLEKSEIESLTYLIGISQRLWLDFAHVESGERCRNYASLSDLLRMRISSVDGDSE